MKDRPDFTEIKTFEDFSKYYWYREDLISICRQLDIPAGGYKAELNQRIEDYFKGKEPDKRNVGQNQGKLVNHMPSEELSLDKRLIECGFKFSQGFRDFFSAQTGIKNFKFNVDMVATVRKVRETGDASFTLGDLLDIFYGRKTYAQYDRVSLQWNKFVKDFCSDPATAKFPNKLKTAARLWKEVRESTREKVYRHELLQEFREMLK